METISSTMIPQELWQRVKNLYLMTLQSAEEKSQAERHFSWITSVSIVDGKLVLNTANAFAPDMLKEKYADRLKGGLNMISGNAEMSIEFTFDTSSKPSLVLPTETRQTKTSSFISTMPLNESYTFDEFVTGPSNSWAHGAAKGVVANLGKAEYNPLFIHGGTGLGKTHLMQAIGNAIKKKNPGAAVCYITAEVFLNEYVNMLSNGKVQQFRDRYRKVDLLLIDDIQFIAKNMQNFQEEFFNTFNALHLAEKQIVMTSDVAPKDLPGIEERLISRFEGGMVQEIELPSYETRLAILKKKAEGSYPTIPDDALKFIAQNIKSHVRAMEGALTKLRIMLQIDNSIRLTEQNLTYTFRDLIEKEKTQRKITIEEIQTAVAKKYAVSISQILSTDRTSSIVTPRQLSMYIARKFTNKSLTEIATKFEKTHATIIHGIKNITKRLDVEPELKENLESILGEFGYSIEDNVD